MKFKIGDKVRCVSYDGERGGAGWRLEHIFTITDVTDYHDKERNLCWGGFGNNGVYELSLELVDEAKKERKIK